MKRRCNQCHGDMIEDCLVNVQGGMYGLTIIKKMGLLKSVSAKPKASVCPNCGYVALYIEDASEFNK
ncbi:nucleic acid-binding protein [Peribacillus sp. SI8-4]|uniref:nucleic acid-binding protein n=1 Tax=Peribacillus sp. SI8-4 TaxID=3048009 RepID=UPI002552C052|nr:nucleic acid-binding protein [Peribacillus sp. SI8-4]